MVHYKYQTQLLNLFDKLSWGALIQLNDVGLSRSFAFGDKRKHKIIFSVTKTKKRKEKNNTPFVFKKKKEQYSVMNYLLGGKFSK